jgi:tetratricopeptide (TPR) repeat protein
MMGELLRAQGKRSEAKRYYVRSLAMRERLSGPNHASLASPLSNLGEIACAEKRFGDAREKCGRALALAEKAGDKKDPDLAYYLTCLGRAELGLGNPARALEHLERALALRTGSHPPPLELAATRLNLARALFSTGGDRARALDLVKQARDAHRNAPFVPKPLRAELAAWDRAHP